MVGRWPGRSASKIAWFLASGPIFGIDVIVFPFSLVFTWYFELYAYGSVLYSSIMMVPMLVWHSLVDRVGGVAFDDVGHDFLDSEAVGQKLHHFGRWTCSFILLLMQNVSVDLLFDTGASSIVVCWEGFLFTLLLIFLTCHHDTSFCHCTWGAICYMTFHLIFMARLVSMIFWILLFFVIGFIATYLSGCCTWYAIWAMIHIIHHAIGQKH